MQDEKELSRVVGQPSGAHGDLARPTTGLSAETFVGLPHLPWLGDPDVPLFVEVVREDDGRYFASIEATFCNGVTAYADTPVAALALALELLKPYEKVTRAEGTQA